MDCPFNLHLKLSVFWFSIFSSYTSGQSQLIVPSQPIVGQVGDDIILPCHLKPAADVSDMMLEWMRFDLNSIFVNVRRNGHDQLHIKNPSYKDRTSLFIDELKRGNMSLKLSKVKPSDQGTYQCYIAELDERSSIRLIVASDPVSSPVVTLEGIDQATSSLVLQCESGGWYPKPEVLWLDGEGKLLSAGPPETVRGPDDLYTVSSRVTVEKRHSNNFTCRVQQKGINQTRETHINVPDDFFNVQSSSSTTICLALSLAVCILLTLLLAWFVLKPRQNVIKFQDKYQRKNKTELKPINNELKDQKKEFEEKEAKLKKELLEEKQEKEKARSEVKELERKLERNQAETIKQLQEKEKAQKELKNKLESQETETNRQLVKEKQEKEKAGREVNNLKSQLESKKNEEAETNRLLQKEKQEKEKARRDVKDLKSQLESQKNELEKQKEEFEKEEAKLKQELWEKIKQLKKQKEFEEKR